MLVVDKDIYDDEVSYSFSMQDSSYSHGYNTLFGRMRRACKILFGKPIYYNDIYIEDLKKFSAFVKELNELDKWSGEEDE